jgi:ankyrin repeat protein
VYGRYSRLVAALRTRRDDLDLFEARCVGDTPRVVALLDAAPELLYTSSPDGFAALGYSAFFGHPELLRELLRRGAPVNEHAKNAMHVSPLHSAAAHSDTARALELAHALLDAGADPNLKQHGGYTPLHEAAYHDRRELATLLLSRGADPNLPNDQGERPVDLARTRGHTSSVELLERA